MNDNTKGNLATGALAAGSLGAAGGAYGLHRNVGRLNTRVGVQQAAANKAINSRNALNMASGHAQGAVNSAKAGLDSTISRTASRADRIAAATKQRKGLGGMVDKFTGRSERLKQIANRMNSSNSQKLSDAGQRLVKAEAAKSGAAQALTRNSKRIGRLNSLVGKTQKAVGKSKLGRGLAIGGSALLGAGAIGSAVTNRQRKRRNEY